MKESHKEILIEEIFNIIVENRFEKKEAENHKHFLQFLSGELSDHVTRKEKGIKSDDWKILKRAFKRLIDLASMTPLESEKAVGIFLFLNERISEIEKEILHPEDEKTQIYE
jgi:hypothetical protein